jgi:hypothetical protein
LRRPDQPLTFIDVSSTDKQIGHIHNVTAPDLPESQNVNACMIQFMKALPLTDCPIR